MRYLKSFAVLAILMMPFEYSQAQVRVGIGVGIGPAYVAGPPPVCSYGYYNYYPYACAPYGYYGPSWFVNGAFIGAGPWYHWGHPAWFWNRGWYAGRDWDRARWYGHEGWGRGWGGQHYAYRPAGGARAYAHGDGFRGGQSLRGGEFHSGGAFHGGGFHGGGRHR